MNASPSPFLRRNVDALAPYTPGEQPTDPQIIKLNTNENPYPPTPRIGEWLHTFHADALRLYPDPVCRALREAIAALHGCRIEQVFCGNGSDEVLALCIRAFVETHAAVGYFDPSYSLYPVLAAIADVSVRPIPLNPDFSWPSIPERYDVPLFFWTNPNAPTSLSCPYEPIEAYAARSEGVVVLDEAYADFAATNGIKLALSMENVLVTRTLSKSYSLAGLRLGYTVGPEPLIHALYKIKDSYNVDRITQEIGRLAILDQDHLRANTARILATRERITSTLRAMGATVLPSQTNFLWVKPAGQTAAQCFEKLRAAKILTRYFPASATKDYLRITIGADAQMDALISVL